MKSKHIKIYLTLMICATIPIKSEAVIPTRAWINEGNRSGGCYAWYSTSISGGGSASEPQPGRPLLNPYTAITGDLGDKTINKLGTVDVSTITNINGDKNLYVAASGMRTNNAGTGGGIGGTSGNLNQADSGGSTASVHWSDNHIDTTGPSCKPSVTPQRQCNGYYGPKSGYNIQWNPEDAGCSGLKGGNVTTSHTSSGTQNKVFYDNFGNRTATGCSVNPSNYGLTYDNLGPSITLTSSNANDTQWTSNDVVVSASSVSDRAGASTRNCSTQTLTSNGTARICCTDCLSNSNCTTKTITKIDKTPPACQNEYVKLPSSGLVRADQLVDASVGCNDGNGSGCQYGTWSGKGQWGKVSITINDSIQMGNNNYQTCNFGYPSDGEGPTVQITFDDAHKSYCIST